MIIQKSVVKTKGAFGTQIIPGFPENVDSDAHTESPQEPAMLPLQTKKAASKDDSSSSDVLLHGSSWWTRGSPRLLTTDTPEHVESVVATDFGAGVDLDRYLEPARLVFERFSKVECEELKKKGLLLMKIPAS
jgi:hypothetical protein